MRQKTKEKKRYYSCGAADRSPCTVGLRNYRTHTPFLFCVSVSRPSLPFPCLFFFRVAVSLACWFISPFRVHHSLPHPSLLFSIMSPFFVRLSHFRSPRPRSLLSIPHPSLNVAFISLFSVLFSPFPLHVSHFFRPSNPVFVIPPFPSIPPLSCLFLLFLSFSPFSVYLSPCPKTHLSVSRSSVSFSVHTPLSRNPPLAFPFMSHLFFPVSPPYVHTTTAMHDMSTTPHATRSTPHVSLRAWRKQCLPGRMKTRRAPSRPYRDSRVYGHTTTGIA